MDHERGKDPTPGGRMPARMQQPDHPSPKSEVEAKYVHSAPAPDHMDDGAAFFGYKRENAYPENPTRQP